VDINKKQGEKRTKIYEGRTFESYDGIHWTEIKNGN